VSARHRTRRTVGRGRVRVPLALAVVAGLVLVTAVSIRLVAASASGCTGSVGLRVIAAPEIQPSLTEIGDAWMATKPEVGGECVALTVVAQDSPTMASSLTVLAGNAIDVAGKPQPTPVEDALPAVGKPDPTARLGRVQVVDRSAFEDGLQVHRDVAGRHRHAGGGREAVRGAGAALGAGHPRADAAAGGRHAQVRRRGAEA
jgi:hypothetical protein